ncbi:hypothetical protein EIP86_009618 [Pleurotus ostreatoroseus]|nr:hypothetical protein EIP86_009618 [Pleurotus ostreatoroseus]
MPQIYRRHSEYAPGTLAESRLRTTIASNPQLTDADDSIVLSDLVRTGEASRLRRRGAMRLEHGAPRPLLTGNPPVPATSSRFGPPPLRPVYVPPSRPNSPPFGSYPYRPPMSGDEEDRFSFSLSAESWRPGEWAPEEPAGEAFSTQSADDDRREYEREGDPELEQEYILVCGGEEYRSEKEYVDPFKPSILPVPSRKASSTSTRPHSRRSNGCGAVIHMRAIPQQRRGVWQSAAHAAPTDIVVGLDSGYFDRGVVAKMLRSACGCVREGVGCAVCGNPLGTRYLPCPAASEGIFASPNTASAPSNPCPRHPSDPRYWDPRLPSTSHSDGRVDNFFVYTFFADRVSSRPPVDFEFKIPQPHPLPPPPRREPRRMPEMVIMGSPEMPTSALPQEDSSEENGQGWYGFRASASPRPFSYAETEIADTPTIISAPLPASAVDDDMPYEEYIGMLDADGVLLSSETRTDNSDDTVIGGAMDNDKSATEPTMLSGR